MSKRISVLVGYERSGIVRNAFRAHGCDAWSCDLRPAVDGSPFHIQADARSVAGVIPDSSIGYLRRHYYTNVGGVSVEAPRRWDIVIVHPPCTYLSVSGLHWNKRRPWRATLTEKAIVEVATWFEWAHAFSVPLALENPVGVISTRLRPATQYVQPYMFGDDASKKTGLWLIGLPPLVVPHEESWIIGRIANGKPRWSNQTDSGQNRLGPTEDRAALRSKTYPAIAAAMACQWSMWAKQIREE